MAYSNFYQINLIHFKHSDYNSPTDGAIVIYALLQKREIIVDRKTEKAVDG